MAMFKPEHKKTDLNVARLKKNGHDYEVIIDSEAALKFRKGEGELSEALLVDKVFKDARTGDVAGDLIESFGTDDFQKVASEILLKGEVQLSEEYRHKILEVKRNQVLEAVTRKAFDPQTHYPVPRQRVELGMDKLGYKIRFEKSVDEQVNELMDKLKKVMPISFGDIMVTITSPAQFTGQVYALTKKGAEITSQDYLPDGSLSMRVKLSAGLLGELRDKLRSISHGLIKIQEE
jgi:ribosome maturation protein SDO1